MTCNIIINVKIKYTHFFGGTYLKKQHFCFPILRGRSAKRSVLSLINGYICCRRMLTIYNVIINNCMSDSKFHILEDV